MIDRFFINVEVEKLPGTLISIDIDMENIPTLVGVQRRKETILDTLFRLMTEHMDEVDIIRFADELLLRGDTLIINGVEFPNVIALPNPLLFMKPHIIDGRLLIERS